MDTFRTVVPCSHRHHLIDETYCAVLCRVFEQRVLVDFTCFNGRKVTNHGVDVRTWVNSSLPFGHSSYCHLRCGMSAALQAQVVRYKVYNRASSSRRPLSVYRAFSEIYHLTIDVSVVCFHTVRVLITDL